MLGDGIPLAVGVSGEYPVRDDTEGVHSVAGRVGSPPRRGWGGVRRRGAWGSAPSVGGSRRVRFSEDYATESRYSF